MKGACSSFSLYLDLELIFQFRSRKGLMSHPFLFLDFFFFPINSEMEEEPVGDVDQSFYPVFSFVMGSMC